ncbi:hydrophobin-251 [Schizopora paradoxa]|uniref:Hydrophobin n=1 Tax=Schizopora paradoxa TaxID=27342 RepID=A0A0H2SJP4_9AGAM|nr:hydrophobin-251 [Schizopora paradoxa]
MFSKLAVLASLAIFAVATPTGVSSGPANLCCDQTQTANSAAGAALLGSIGVVIQDVTGLVGSDCSPITGVGVSGTSCTNDPVDCQQFFAQSLIGINCSPIDISL